MTFTNPKQWWKYSKEDIMRHAYWERNLLPPSDKDVYEHEWQNIKRQLIAKYGEGDSNKQQ